MTGYWSNRYDNVTCHALCGLHHPQSRNLVTVDVMPQMFPAERKETPSPLSLSRSTGKSHRIEQETPRRYDRTGNHGSDSQQFSSVCSTWIGSHSLWEKRASGEGSPHLIEEIAQSQYCEKSHFGLPVTTRRRCRPQRLSHQALYSSTFRSTLHQQPGPNRLTRAVLIPDAVPDSGHRPE